MSGGDGGCAPAQRYGGWTLVRPIGRGGMGEVWLARGDDGAEAAVKVIFARPDRREAAARRFEREVAAASQIGHPGIVQVIDFGVTEGAMFLAMERLEGRSLRGWMEDGGGPAEAALDLFEALLEPLAAAHALIDEHGARTPIVHRDLKPENVFVLEPPVDGVRVKLLDFGIARQTGGGEARVTDTGVGLGTAAYMSPEQATDATRVGPRSDVFSLGVLLYELLAGRRPFEAPSRNEVIAQILTTDPPPLSAGGATPALSALVERCLSKAPEARPADAGALARCLREARQAPDRVRSVATALETQTDSGLAVSAPHVRRSSSRVWWLAAAAIGALGLFAISVVVTTPPPMEDPEEGEPQLDLEDAGAPAEPAESNTFVPIAPGPTPLYVAEASEGETGFRVGAEIRGPDEPYAIQRHEVTWGELEPWLDRERRDPPSVLGRDRPSWLGDGVSRARFPATGLTWSLARDYCRSLDADLPTEEQWAHAARGLDRRPYPSGVEAPAADQINAGPDPDAHPLEVMSRPADRTPGPDSSALFDLLGNAREWTLDVYRADETGVVTEWAAADELVFRAVRGLPLIEASRWRVPEAAPLAHRVPLCAEGPCAEGTERARLDVGFRCARAGS